MKVIPTLLLTLILLPAGFGTGVAGGPFGPPQTGSKGTGGLYTVIGVWHQEDRYGIDGEYLFRQNQLYSEAGYGAMDRWKIYARIGLSDLNVQEAFSPTTPAMMTSKSDFDDGWGVFGTLGAAVFFPFNATFGIGAFLQANTYFSDFQDQVTGSRDGALRTMELRVKDLRDLNIGFALQGRAPHGVTFYGGPCFTFSEAVLSPSADISGFRFGAGDDTVRNRGKLGGFAGVEANLAGGFRLNIEGLYARRPSAGLAIQYIY